ncbi:hypothetical protein [Methylobacillus glycogenes]|uniref:hypothetical protein n=1 Tax=Methylobacillus glycogenes TaxID=406 RepID=UPI000471FD21|nr:hypothetical protein [Methylobacillus glycogenes]
MIGFIVGAVLGYGAGRGHGFSIEAAQFLLCLLAVPMAGAILFYWRLRRENRKRKDGTQAQEVLINSRKTTKGNE